METENKIKQLRESTGMSRVRFCSCLDIPYRTVADWELGKRHAPDYVVRLIAYYLRAEGLLDKAQAKS